MSGDEIRAELARAFPGAVAQPYTSKDSFDIEGRGTAYVVTSPAGQAIPKPGDVVVLDECEAIVRGVECPALTEDALTAGRVDIALCVRFAEVGYPFAEARPRSFDLEDGKLVGTIHLDLGAEAVIEDIQLSGARVTKPKTVFRLIE